MGLLNHLWDDTVAGPLPDSGLGKLRKNSTFSFRSSSAKQSETGNMKSYGDETTDDAMRVTRSIMLVRPPDTSQNGSPPVSPAGSTPPVSPFSGSGGREAYRFRRRLASISQEKASGIGTQNSAPPYNV